MRIGVVGDPHGCWGSADNHYFDHAGYDLVLVTGDLGAGTERSALAVTRAIARMRTPTLIMLGNNDAPFAPTIAAELQHSKGLAALGQVTRPQRPFSHMGNVSLCGYSQHVLCTAGLGLGLIAGRPLATGGDHFAYPERLRELYGVCSAQDSEARLLDVVSTCPARHLLFFAHNGPAGLGAAHGDIWGCDFREGGGDYGDTDLTAAVEHARRLGKRVLAVIAGHMHLRTKQGSERPVMVTRENTLYVNAARVPRIFSGPEGPLRHHVAIQIRDDQVQAREVFVPDE